jgi:hypothetical protein
MKHQQDHLDPMSITNDQTAAEKNIDLEKIVVECICPKCGVKHFMNFPWTGRGTPRKFCPKCKV